MKCVKKGDAIKRVSNDEAYHLVDSFGWSYCEKSLWRASDPTYKNRKMKKERGSTHVE